MKLTIRHFATDISINDFNAPDLKTAERAEINRYWNGEEAPHFRHSCVKMAWSANALYAVFDASQEGEPVIAENPDLRKKTMNLWDRDVVEIFLAPDKEEPRIYFEFEAAPTGEWLDVAIDSTSGTRLSDWDYESGMETTARIKKNSIVIAVKIPWNAFGKKPEAGDVWLGNILRCVGKEPDRGYLAWSPTFTEQPNFHVPEYFGEFHFVK